MTLSTTDRATLTFHARVHPLPAEWDAIHYLAALYLEYGRESPLDVTRTIADAVRSPTGDGAGRLGAAVGIHQYFHGFIEGSNSMGFRTEVSDPNPTNAQTGHFFSYAVWALDGIDSTELTIALGHELYPDTHEWDQFPGQVLSGVRGAGNLRRVIVALPLDGNAALDYRALDTELRGYGWDETSMTPYDRESGFSDPEHQMSWANYIGNSIEDLRCTVAGMQFGRLVRSGCFADSTAAARWLEINILDSSLRPRVSGLGPVTLVP